MPEKNLELAAELGLPPIDQVGYVVRDLDKALETFGPIFGPFAKMESALEGTSYRGRRSDVTLRMAFGKSGPLEIELIEWVSGESPHKEALDAGNEGVHHVRFRIDDIATFRSRLEKQGFSVVWSHGFPGSDIEWAYMEGPADRGGALVELYQNPHVREDG
jgi:catechol 2,3-dioxygenase-like lactoylglutathione lyase family enzyme